LPEGVTVTVTGRTVAVAGPRGQLTATLHPAVSVASDGRQAVVSVRRPDRPEERALWGLWRNLVRNMVTGVTVGFTRTLEVTGVGYKVATSGQTVTLHLGFSHPVTVTLPSGITATVEKNTLTVAGNDKQVVGHIAANIRRLRPPEPYKGKGIRYSDEVVRRKAGKAVKAVGK
jgi:large subunit ribosomal protein L6